MSFAEVKKELWLWLYAAAHAGREEVGLAQFSQMVDEYLAAGFNCFDTARVVPGRQK